MPVGPTVEQAQGLWGQKKQRDEVGESHEAVPKVYRGPEGAAVQDAAQGDAQEKGSAAEG